MVDTVSKADWLGNTTPRHVVSINQYELCVDIATMQSSRKIPVTGAFLDTIPYIHQYCF